MKPLTYYHDDAVTQRICDEYGDFLQLGCNDYHMDCICLAEILSMMIHALKVVGNHPASELLEDVLAGCGVCPSLRVRHIIASLISDGTNEKRLTGTLLGIAAILHEQ